MSARTERRLGRIESELKLSVPRLAWMFGIFSELTEGERPNGAERLPAPARLPWLARLPWPGWPSWPLWLSSLGWGAAFRRPEAVPVLLLAVATMVGIVVAGAHNEFPCPRPAASAQSRTPWPSRQVITAAPPAAQCPVYIAHK